jgi:curved DNA-binding protein CbpA
MNLFNNNLKRNINLFRYFCTTNTRSKLDYSKLNYYEILGVNPATSPRDMKQKFLELAKQYHPDKYKGPDTERFRHVKEAYDTLRNPAKRKEYNRKNDINEHRKEDFGQEFKNEKEKSSMFDEMSLDDSVDFEKEYEKFMSQPNTTDPGILILQEHPFLQGLNEQERIRYEMVHMLNNKEMYMLKYAHQSTYAELLKENIKLINDRADYTDNMKQENEEKAIKKDIRFYKVLKFLMVFVLFPFVAMTLHKRRLLFEERDAEAKKYLRMEEELEARKVQKRLIF